MFPLIKPAFYVSKFNFILPLRHCKQTGFSLVPIIAWVSGCFHFANQVRDIGFIVEKLRQFLLSPSAEDQDASRFLNVIGNFFFSLYTFGVVYLLVFNVKRVVSILETLRLIFQGVTLREDEYKCIKRAIYGMTIFMCAAYYAFRIYDLLDVFSFR
jgi:hypothetical protein